MKRGEVIELEISKMAYGGQAIAKWKTEAGELVAFVPNTIPGQRVQVRVEQVRKNHLETRLIQVLAPSPQEVPVPYQPIAGAPYTTLPIDLQEAYKRDTTIDLLRRIGGVRNAEALYHSFISSPMHWHYRNKMEYAFAAIRYDLSTRTELDDFALGFKHRGTWWMVENLDADSGLFDPLVENNLHRIRTFCESTGLPPWHAPRREGFFRYLTVRKSHATGELLFNLVTTSIGLNSFPMDGFVALLRSLFAERLSGILHTTNDDTGDRVQPLEGSTRTVYGRDYITETIHGLHFDIRMKSFFQTNPTCAALLYARAIEYLPPAGDVKGVVLDLFCGTGTIARLVAAGMPHAKVVGVDIEPTAITDAQKKAHGVPNLSFHAADAGKFLLEHPQYAGRLGAVILDPPRAGIAPKTLKRVIDLGAPCIVYISCNPTTLARDTKTLQEQGYTLERYSIVDQFPHTAHVEAVARFSKSAK